MVGVARNVRDESLERETEIAFYAPGPADPLLVRTSGDPEDVLPAIRERVWSYDENLPIIRAAGLPSMIDEFMAEERYRARLMGVFAVLAGLLALLGIYGVTSRAVTRRTREIGIRVALGAERDRVWRMVGRQAAGLAGAGAFLGVVASLVSSRFIESFLFGVTATDPGTLVAVMIGLPLLGLLAAFVPARRATRVDPVIALKEE